MLTATFMTAGRKLKLIQANDPYKQWWSLDEIRFCAKCEHPFLGSQIKLFEDEYGHVHFQCPTLRCPGGFEDWEYPQLHL